MDRGIQVLRPVSTLAGRRHSSHRRPGRFIYERNALCAVRVEETGGFPALARGLLCPCGSREAGERKREGCAALHLALGRARQLFGAAGAVILPRPASAIYSAWRSSPPVARVG